MAEPRLIILAGNPNVGKSTLFNALTGMRQHTGNWSGKTVAAARGACRLGQETFHILDVPGAYSLLAQSAEEEAALEAIAFGGADAVVVVCDGTCLERNLNLVYQVMEITDRVSVCVNMMDETKKKGVRLDLAALSRRLGVPVTGVCARDGAGLKRVLAAARETMDYPVHPRRAVYPEAVEHAAAALARQLSGEIGERMLPRFAALRLMEDSPCLKKELRRRGMLDKETEDAARRLREETGFTPEELSAMMVEEVYREAEDTCRLALSAPPARLSPLDRLLTGWRGVPAMLALLALVFFLTLKGANVPSNWLAAGFSALEGEMNGALVRLGLSDFWRGLVVDGIVHTLGQVISVMLPPMAVFFPLFTLLEDSGYLPRIAFTLDGLFERCHACGKQALTMCMGFGCNAVGVMGCRIIDSPRERLVAILTNCLVPCNGRFPLLITMSALFFFGGGLASAAMLTGLAVLSLGMTLLLSRLLSVTVLRGLPSSFTLELPPYRMPRVGRVIVRSALDRTLFVLGRAAAVAAPAGLVIYLLAHLAPGGQSLLSRLTAFLDPLGRLMGLDGVILAGFLLGFPANEIVLPLILMAYTAGGGLGDAAGLAALGGTLRAHGWTALTALNVMLFSLFHFPCSTTLITIYRETKSEKWTLAAFFLPLALGVVLCMATNFVSKFF